MRGYRKLDKYNVSDTTDHQHVQYLIDWLQSSRGQSRQGQVRHATWDLYYSALSLQLATGSSSIEGKLFRIIVDNTLQPHKSSYRRYFKDKEEK